MWSVSPFFAPSVAKPMMLIADTGPREPLLTVSVASNLRAAVAN